MELAIELPGAGCSIVNDLAPLRAGRLHPLSTPTIVWSIVVGGYCHHPVYHSVEVLLTRSDAEFGVLAQQIWLSL